MNLCIEIVIMKLGFSARFAIAEQKNEISTKIYFRREQINEEKGKIN